MKRVIEITGRWPSVRDLEGMGFEFVDGPSGTVRIVSGGKFGVLLNPGSDFVYSYVSKSSRRSKQVKYFEDVFGLSIGMLPRFSMVVREVGR